MTELDGALGIQDVAAGELQAIMGDADTGPFATPAAFGSIDAVKATFASAGKFSPLVEAAARSIELHGKPVVLVRTARTTLGTTSDLVTTGVTGTCTPTVDSSVHPTDDAEVGILVTTGGTVGTAGITYKWTRDGFRTLSVETALGTALTITVPGIGVKFNVGSATTLIAGDKFSVIAHAPQPSAADIGAALDALIASKQPWEYVTILCDGTGTIQDTIETKMSGAHAKGKHHWAQLAFRMPNVGESDASYQTAAATSFSSHTSVNVDRYAGAAKVLSSISFEQRRRHAIFAVADLYATVGKGKDLAKLEFGPLEGTQIRDSNGNLDEHDEFEEPGLDALKFSTLRTWHNRDGVFLNNPRLACPDGSDFVLVQYRRVMNVARTVLQAYLEERTSQDILVNASTGFILESEAREIESGANVALETALLAEPMASSVKFTLSRTDNLLSTQTLTYQCRIVPLGYAKTISGTIGFNNPAIRAVAA